MCLVLGESPVLLTVAVAPVESVCEHVDSGKHSSFSQKLFQVQGFRSSSSACVGFRFSAAECYSSLSSAAVMNRTTK